jgi:regulation of enolase protein 1 (concanavalin A-like superfamily)
MAILPFATAIAALTLSIPAMADTTVTDNFDTAHDYVPDGVTRTIWNGVVNAGNAVTFNSSTTTAGQLRTAAANAVGWDAGVNNAPFLYMDVTGDFDARVQVTAMTTGNYNVGALMARLGNSSDDGTTGEDFMMVASNKFGTVDIQGRSLNDATKLDSNGTSALDGFPRWLRLTRTSNTFNIYYGTDGTNWTGINWGGVVGANIGLDLVRNDLNGLSLQVGLWQGSFASSGHTADFDNFSITTPGPDTTPPVAGGTNPVAGSSGVSPTDDLTLQFSEQVQLGAGAITIHRASDGSVIQTINVSGGAVTIVGTKVTIDIGDLAYDTSYYVNIAAGAFTDMSDNPYPGITDSTTWAFTTGSPAQPFTLRIARNGANLEFGWPSEPGKLYNLLSHADLSSGPSTWSAYHDGTTTHANIPASGTGTNVLTVPMPADPVHFFAVSQYPEQIDAATLAAWSAPYRNWTYHPNHVIPASPNIPGYPSVSMTDVPTVFQLPGDPKWYMTFIGFDGGGYQSFIAESTDLVNWTNRRLAMPYGPAGAFDYGGVVLGAYLYESYDIKARRTLKLKDGKFWSLYGAYDSRSGYEAGVGSNGLASSSDGVNWTRFQNEPVLSIYDADRGAWENNVIYQPWLVEHQGIFYNHYNAKGGPEQIGTATSSDLLSWTRYANNPVIPVGASIYNTSFSADLKIFWDRDHWVGFFFGVGAGGAHIMAAFSRDLYNWTVDPTPLYLAGGNPSGLDSSYAHKISLVWNPANETFYMYYNAVGNQGRGIGLITSKQLTPGG